MPKPMPTSALPAYIQRLTVHPVLSRAEECDLASRYQAGDKRAGDRLIACNQRWIVKRVLSYGWSGADIEDLFQEANLALLTAARKFDPKRDVKFVTYADCWIRSRLRRYLEDNCLVKLARNTAERKLLHHLRTVQFEMGQDGEAPTTEQVAERMEVSPRQVAYMDERLARIVVSLDHSPPGHVGGTLGDIIPDDSPTPDALAASAQHDQRIRAAMAEAMFSMPAKWKELLHLRYLVDKPLTLDEVGQRFGVCRERVRQLQEKSLEHLGCAMASALRRLPAWTDGNGSEAHK